MSKNWKVNVSHLIVRATENFFYKLGSYIAEKPWKTIIISWAVILVSLFGLLSFRQEKNPLKLWVPEESDYYIDAMWLINKFKHGVRPQLMIIRGENVLTSEVLLQLEAANRKLWDNTAEGGVNWKDICLKVPIVNMKYNYIRKKPPSNKLQTSKDNKLDINEDDDDDLSIIMNPLLYCSFYETMKLGCLQYSLLDFWNNNRTEISQVTTEDILHKLNTVTISPTFGHPFNYTTLLGNVKRNSTGHIVSAESILSMWMAYVNFDDVDMDKAGNSAGTADWATESLLFWEQEFLNIMQNASEHAVNCSISFEAGRSFGDISGAAMFRDVDKIAIGVIFMVVYLQIVLSKYNWLEIRVALGSVGLLCIGMAFICAVSLCSLLGISYGPVHTSLPFLLMGLGVDDMFVIMACWNQLSGQQTRLPLKERIALMMKHAGVSVTVTSITDITAFLVGATTILPALRSFCLYCAMAVFVMYVLVITFFPACFVLDQRRVEQRRNGIVPCIVHPVSYTQNITRERTLMQKTLTVIYSKVILTLPGKIITLVIVAALTGIGIQSALKLEQKFEPNWFIPESAYLYKFIEDKHTYYPDMGHEVSIFMGNLNYTAELHNIHDLVTVLKNRTDIVTAVDTWTTPFFQYLKKQKEKLDPYSLTDEQWKKYISKFLFSPTGAKYLMNFKFKDDLQCGEPASDVVISKIDFRLNVFNKPEKYVPTLNELRQLTLDVNVTTGDRLITIWGKILGNWITDEIIDGEMIRNLCLAMVCVMACTLLLINNFQICFWIFLCVLLTIVDVCGFMQRWDLTIDIVACIGLQLAVGLCVDYAAHVGHTFLTIGADKSVENPRNDRTIQTISHIGAAILYGGGSTLLALSMLSQSEAYIFQSFFKIFMLVIIFGLFHGLVLLPVILSTIGPAAYSHVTSENDEKDDQSDIEMEINDKS